MRSESPLHNLAMRPTFTAKECWAEGHGAPRGTRCEDCDGLHIQEQTRRDYDRLDRELVAEMRGDQSEGARVTRSYLGLAGGDMSAEEIRETATWKRFSAFWTEALKDTVPPHKDGSA